MRAQEELRIVPLRQAPYQAPALRYEFVLATEPAVYRVLKRALDLAVAVVGLLVAAPVMLLVALAVRATGEPILFRQTRIGEGGRPFTVLKFRTMTTTADPYALKPVDDAPTVTPVGRVLRATGLDELPQLINVLRGEMTLVGPRPEMPFLAEGYDDLQRLRLRARPGVTGLWQISHVRKRPIHDHIEYDLFYLAHRTLLLDLWIILRTPLVLFLGRHITLDARMIRRWGSQDEAGDAGGHRVSLEMTEPGNTVVDLVAADA